MKSLESKVTDYYGKEATVFIDKVKDGMGRYDLSEALGCSLWKARRLVTIIKTHDKPKPKIEGVTADEDVDIQDIYDRSVKAFERKEKLSQRRKAQTIEFPEKEICIAFGGDEHFGNPGTDVERAFDEAETIAGTPNMYAWKMGDLADNFIIGYLVAKNVEAPIKVIEQWHLAKAYLDIQRQSIIAVLGGNHDAWTALMSHIDQLKSIVPGGVLYDKDEIKADVFVGDAKFPVWARHKWKGNSIYNDTHGQERAARFDDSSFTIYAGAHVHKGCFFREFQLAGKRKAALLSGTYKMHDDYQRQQGFKANDKSTVCPIILRPDGTFDKMNLKHAASYMNNLK